MADTEFRNWSVAVAAAFCATPEIDAEASAIYKAGRLLRVSRIVFMHILWMALKVRYLPFTSKQVTPMIISFAWISVKSLTDDYRYIPISSIVRSDLTNALPPGHAKYIVSLERKILRAIAWRTGVETEDLEAMEALCNAPDYEAMYQHILPVDYSDI